MQKTTQIILITRDEHMQGSVSAVLDGYSILTCSPGSLRPEDVTSDWDRVVILDCDITVSEHLTFMREIKEQNQGIALIVMLDCYTATLTHVALAKQNGVEAVVLKSCGIPDTEQLQNVFSAVIQRLDRWKESIATVAQHREMQNSKMCAEPVGSAGPAR